MPNIMSVLNEQIRRLARREITANTRSTRRATAQYRRDIAALKRQVAALTKRLALTEKAQPQEVAAPPEVLEKARFRAMGVKAHRAKLGLSAKGYGQLVGVSELTIYQWEGGKSRPRQAQKARWLAIRSLGKREALQRLGMNASQGTAPTAGTQAPAAQPRGKRRTGPTRPEFILSLLKGRKALPTAAINAAWKKDGRPGTADNTLGLMVQAGQLQRKVVPGQRGGVRRI